MSFINSSEHLFARYIADNSVFYKKFVTATSDNKTSADSLTISPEAAALYEAKKQYINQRISLEEQQRIDSLMQAGVICHPLRGDADIEANSNHYDVTAWALGMQEREDYLCGRQFDYGAIRNKAILESAKLDTMVSKLLSSNGINQME